MKTVAKTYTRSDFIICVGDDVNTYEGVPEDYEAFDLVGAALDAGELTLETPIREASALIAQKITQT